jgi:iron complex transport system ATP-binding protein
MAMRYADHVVLFSKGRIVADGPTGEMLTEACVEEVFGVTCRFVTLPGESMPVLVTLPKESQSERCFASAAE